MTKRLSSKHKIDRRLGLNLWGRPKSPFNRRPYGPGQHGQARRRKPSDFGIQLAAKQKLKKYYGDITEKQFLKIYQAASRKKGDTSQILIELLERRLDAVVFRLKFAPTVFSARQLVNHGHVLVNGKVVNKKSYRVMDGDEISLQQTSQNIPITPIIIAIIYMHLRNIFQFSFFFSSGLTDSCACFFASFSCQACLYVFHNPFRQDCRGCLIIRQVPIKKQKIPAAAASQTDS